MSRRILATMVTCVLVGCGGGVPVQVRIDEAATRLDLSALVGQAESALTSTGLLPGDLTRLPELWPTGLPDVQRSFKLPIPPIPIDLSPEPGDPLFDKYEAISKYADAIRRIEINRLVLRVERTNLTMDLPELTLQAADSKDANPDDRRAWFTIGKLPSVPKGAVGDHEFEWAPGGESFLNAQLWDESREFALRVTGRVGLDTVKDPVLPRGAADLRLIVVATFFVAPERVLE